MSGTQEAVADLAAEEAQAEADFAAGHAMETQAKPAPKSDAPAAAAPAEPKPAAAPAATPAAAPAAAPAAQPKPKYVQVTEEQFAKWNAAADRLATFDQQFSKVFGSIGDMQKLVRALQAETPRGLKVEIPQDAFADLAKDFPELASRVRKGLEATLKGVTGTAPQTRADPDEIGRTVAERIRAVQLETLQEEYPDWGEIVGAPPKPGEPAKADVPFRKWLATKDPAYQAKINNTYSAALLARAIRTFQRETAQAPPTPKPNPQPQQRREVIRAAVQPRGDGGHPPAAPSDEDELMAGFNSR